jgi:hypothetical protein
MEKKARAEGLMRINFVIRILIALGCALILTTFTSSPIFPEDESQSPNDVHRQAQLYYECCKRINKICAFDRTETQCPNESEYSCVILVKRCTCDLVCVADCPEWNLWDFCRPSCSDAPFVERIEGCNRSDTTSIWEEWYVRMNPGDPSSCNPMECFCELDYCVINPAKKAILGESCEYANPPGIW